MSSTMGFLAKFAGKKFGNSANNLAVWVATKDPETATDVDIDNLRVNFENFGKEVATYAPREEQSHTAMDTLRTQLDRTKQAAQVLGRQLQASPENTDLTARLTTLVTQIKDIGGEEGDGSHSGTLFEAIVDHQQAEDDLHQVQALHAGAAKALADSQLARQRKLAELSRSKLQEQVQADRLHHAEQLANLTNRASGVGSAAFSAIDASIAASQQRSRAAKVNADALAAVKERTTNADDIVSQTLAATPPSPTSVLDQLAKLTGGTGASTSP